MTSMCKAVKLFNIVARLEPRRANTKRCESLILPVLKFNQPHKQHTLINMTTLWGLQRLPGDLYLLHILWKRVHVVCEQIPNIPCLLPKGWKVNYAGKPKQPHLLPSSPCVRPIRIYLFALWVSCVYVCTHVSVCVYLHAIRPPSVCLVGPWTFDDGFQSDKHSKTHICSLEAHMQSSMQLSKVTHTHTLHFYVPGNQYSETRLIPEADGRKGEVQFSLCSTMRCLLLLNPPDCVCVCVSVPVISHLSLLLSPHNIF